MPRKNELLKEMALEFRIRDHLNRERGREGEGLLEEKMIFRKMNGSLEE